MITRKNAIRIVRGVGLGAPLAVFVYWLLNLQTNLTDIYCGFFGILAGVKAGFWAGDWKIILKYHKEALEFTLKLISVEDIKKIKSVIVKNSYFIINFFVELVLMISYFVVGLFGYQYFSHVIALPNSIIGQTEYKAFLLTMILIYGLGLMLFSYVVSIIMAHNYSKAKKIKLFIVFALIFFTLYIYSYISVIILMILFITLFQYLALCIIFTLMRIASSSHMAGIMEGIVIGALAGYIVPVYTLFSIQTGLAMLLGAIVGIPAGLLFYVFGQNKIFISVNKRLNLFSLALEKK